MSIVRPAKKISSELKWDEKYHRTYTSVYQVIAEHTISPRLVALSPGVPAYGSSYIWGDDFDLWAFCKTVSVKPGERIKDPNGSSTDFRKWTLTVVHSSVPSDGSNDNQTPRDNPLDDPPVISGSFSPFTKSVSRDRNGAIIQNTAKHPYEPGAQRNDAYDTLRIAYNTPDLDLGKRAEFRGAVNSANIWGLPPRRAKLNRWDWQILRAGNSLEYVRNTFEFLISYEEHPTADVCTGEANKVGWYTTFPNTGDIYYKTGVITRANERRFTVVGDETPPGPMKLECNGDQRAPASSMLWNVFEVEPEKDFKTILKMPATLPGPFA